ncbi:unnamed protein product [Rotaria sp. Silwood2]|nr:unnamed protein product [Rotaria sp. Silwood2]
MMTVTESTASTMSQSIGYNNYAVNNSYPTTTYDYRHDNSWEKPNYATFNNQSILFSTGGIPSINKFYHPSFDTIPNLNNTNPNFYRRHTESTLQTSNSIYSPSTSNPPSNVPFNYSNNPSELFFGWNNGSSLMRTQSASYQNYSGSTSYPSYNPLTSSSSQLTTNDKSTVNSRVSQMASNNPYPSFYNIIPPINFSLAPPSSIPNRTISETSKLSVPSIKIKRPRITANIRNEILKLKANKPTVFVWEIQQNLLQNGICTAQTLPSATVIQRVLNKSSKNSVTIKEEPKLNVNLPTILNTSSSVTICLSPSPSPTLSNGETICLQFIIII